VDFRTFNLFLHPISPKEFEKIDLKYITPILLFICYCTHAQHSIKKMPYPVNTDVYDEICPILSFKEDELYFTRVGSPDFDPTLIEDGENIYETKNYEYYQSRLRTIYSQITQKAEIDPVGSSFNQDVWYSHYHEGEIYNLFHPGYPLNNALPNSICSHFGTDGSYLVINQFGEEGGTSAGFSVVKKESDIAFTFPEPIVINNFNKTGSDVNVSMSLDKEYIILAMKGPGSRGEQDLYLSIKGYKGIYSEPLHLGDGINTVYREATPFFSQDKKKLYFASNRPGGYGGMDIYVSERLDYSFKKWSPPKLLGRPVNSEFDDSHPYIQIDENSILFTSNREGTSDIYFGKLNRDEKLTYEIDINIYVVKGNERKRANAELYWSEAYDEQYDNFFRARDGKYKYTFTENVPMQFKAENRGYISDIIILDPQELQLAGIKEMDLEILIEKDKNRATVFQRPIHNRPTEISTFEKKSEDGDSLSLPDLVPLEANSTVVLRNILFERATPNVLPVSFPSLLQLASTLKRRTDVIIQVEGHTDNVGDSQALLDLSLSRANSIRQFLIQNGVSQNQVRTKGFGATRPITKNRSEKERSQNRRVEIRVLKQ
jgi:outer membrane protein OmpA-like peptidoglycan-associated protein/Tol biopolymer transport system component